MVKVQGPSGKLVDAVQVDFETSVEPWTAYMLSDGSTIKIRTSIKNVMRLEGEFDNGGNPVYMVSTDVVMRVVKSKMHGEPSTQVSAKPAKAGMEVM